VSVTLNITSIACSFSHSPVVHHKSSISAALEVSYTSMEKQHNLTFGKWKRVCVQSKMVRVKEHVSL